MRWYSAFRPPWFSWQLWSRSAGPCRSPSQSSFLQSWYQIIILHIHTVAKQPLFLLYFLLPPDTSLVDFLIVPGLIMQLNRQKELEYYSMKAMKSAKKLKTDSQTLLDKYISKYPSEHTLSQHSEVIPLLLEYFSKDNTSIFYQRLHLSDCTAAQRKAIADIFQVYLQNRKDKNDGQSEQDEKYIEKIHLTDFVTYLIEVHGDNFEVREVIGEPKQSQGDILAVEDNDYKINSGRSVTHEAVFMNNFDDSKSEQEEPHLLPSSSSRGNKMVPLDGANIQKAPQSSIISNLKPSQKKYLQDYYKYFSRKVSYVPVGKTFDDLKEIYETMNLTQWMQFNKMVGLTSKLQSIYRNKPKTMKFFKQIFVNYEDKSKRLTFNAFCAAVLSMIEILPTLNAEQPTTTQYWLSFIGLTSQKQHSSKMSTMDIPHFPERQVNLRNHPIYTIGGKQHNKQNEGFGSEYVSKNNSFMRGSPQSMSQSKCTRLSQQDNEPKQKTQKKKFKYYVNHEERKQSLLMKKLTLENLKKVNVNEKIKMNLSELVGDDDYYLREYARKQQAIKKGVLDRLDKKVNRVPNTKRK